MVGSSSFGSWFRSGFNHREVLGRGSWADLKKQFRRRALALITVVSGGSPLVLTILCRFCQALESQARDVDHQLARHHQAMAQRLDEIDPNMKVGAH